MSYACKGCGHTEDERDDMASASYQAEKAGRGIVDHPGVDDVLWCSVCYHCPECGTYGGRVNGLSPSASGCWPILCHECEAHWSSWQDFDRELERALVRRALEVLDRFRTGALKT